MSTTDVELSLVDEAVDRFGPQAHALLPTLLQLQRAYGYLPQAALLRLAEITDSSAADIAGVAAFYDGFRHRPCGRSLIRVCNGTACHLKGGDTLHAAFRQALGISGDDDTDAEGEYTVEQVYCLGGCSQAPLVQLNGQIRGPLQADQVPEVLQQLAEHQDPEELLAGDRTQPVQVRVCLDSCCLARGSGQVAAAARRHIAAHGLPVSLQRVSCPVMCERTPSVEISNGPEAVAYDQVAPVQVAALLDRHSRPLTLYHRARARLDGWVDRWVSDANVAATAAIDKRRSLETAAYFGPQRHLVTENFGQSDPLDASAYAASGGWRALTICRDQLSGDAVIDLIEAAGLRGRGGAGFETARKWRLVRQATATAKYIVANGDEGDPGAFMDRMLMESFPFRVLEGLAIAAHAVGAQRGWIYVRAEYPHAVRRLRQAIAACRQQLPLPLEVFEGAGAFVCGEETALLESMEGRRGVPRLRPPYPATAGLWQQPTLINNIETLATLPWIIRHGAEAFRAIGTATSPGTKVFALAGKVQRGGLIEVPIGTSIRDIVERIGGGVEPGRTFKAVMIGGPSGGCVPAALADTTIDYDTLDQVGAMMGSGGLVVLDDTDCVVNLARYFLAFSEDESCGKCTFCRLGTRQLREILDRICSGRGQTADLTTLESLARDVTAGSLCGLGQTAPKPLLTTLRYFPEEYRAHLEGRCPAGVCKPLVRYVIGAGCVGCTLCAQHCPSGAIAAEPRKRHWVLDDRCTRCDLCRRTCPENAITIQPCPTSRSTT